jgi:hypothetical protein
MLISVASAALLLAVSGCGSQNAQPGAVAAHPTVSAPPHGGHTTSPSKAKAKTMTLDRTAITVLGADGVTITTIPFTAAANDVVAQLTRLIGAAPQHSSDPATECSAATETDSWGTALEIRHPRDASTPGATLLDVSSRSKVVGGRISVVAPGGFGVGDSIAAFIAATPAASLVVRSDATYGTEVFYDVNPADNNAAVMTSTVEHGPIVLIDAPGNVNQDC